MWENGPWIYIFPNNYMENYYKSSEIYFCLEQLPQHLRKSIDFTENEVFTRSSSSRFILKTYCHVYLSTFPLPFVTLKIIRSVALTRLSQNPMHFFFLLFFLHKNLQHCRFSQFNLSFLPTTQHHSNSQRSTREIRTKTPLSCSCVLFWNSRSRCVLFWNVPLFLSSARSQLVVCPPFI